MYATNGLADVLGISAEELSGRSFYYCIQENCLQEAVRCLESAKANDSIAYLRFKFRDPRQDDQMDPDEPMQDGHSSEEDEDEGGVHLDGPQDEGGIEYADRVDSFQSRSSSIENQGIDEPRGTYTLDQNSRSSSGNSTDLDGNADHEIFDRSATARSSVSSLPLSSIKGEQMSSRSSDSPTPPQIEIEAVVSCTSDGLVVILRRARSSFPQVTRPAAQTYQQPYANGLFAAPWAANPIIPNLQEAPRYNHLRPFESNGYPVQSDSAQANGMAKAGPPNEDFMNSIRDVAVFAWSLTGINGSLSQYSRGKPTGESQPPTGLPIWDPYSNAGPESDRLDEYGNSPRRTEAFNIQNSSVNTERFPDFVDSTNSMQQAPWSPVHATGTANYEQDPQNFMGNLD
ncbi:hypothetical protein MMC12_002155 [Toensbergia leucococca]|nr:hypothetical protein [Toensbergia leucococca]